MNVALYKPQPIQQLRRIPRSLDGNEFLLDSQSVSETLTRGSLIADSSVEIFTVAFLHFFNPKKKQKKTTFKANIKHECLGGKRVNSNRKTKL